MSRFYKYILVVTVMTVAGSAQTAQSDPSGMSPSVQYELLTVLAEGSDLPVADSNSLHAAADPSVAGFQRIRQTLRMQQIEPLKEMTPGEKDDSLSEMVQKLQSLDISSALMKSQANSKTDSDADTVAEDTNTRSGVNPAASAESDALKHQTILDQLENSDNAAHPLLLADVLYRQGYFAKALKYYDLVGQSLESDDLLNRQWVLFQKANCCYDTDPARALELYSEFIQTYPNAKWTSIAISRKTLLEWNQTNQIKEIIGQNVAVINP